ncbi:MAG: hypothetical protein ACYC7A_22030 [Thermoanaerobaculia bacterium]
MIEGWFNDMYFVLFNSAESSDLTVRYGVERWLPGYVVVGLAGWDNFIVRDLTGHYFIVPTLPLDSEYLSPTADPPGHEQLARDSEARGKIRWYVEPLVFGGEPTDQNVSWVDLLTHVDLVRWWNQKYREVGGGSGADS